MERIETAAAWGRLLERLAADHDALVVDFLVRLEAMGGYGVGLIDRDDLRTTAGDTLDMLIARLAGAPLTDRMRDLPTRLGARRARQGVDRESLLAAVRLDFRVLWAGMQRALQDAPADILVLHAEEVLEVVEGYIGDVQVAFLDEQAALARDSRVVRGRALGRLLGASDDADAVAEVEAPHLQLPLDGTFDVFCVPTGDGEALRSGLTVAGRSTVVWDLDDATVAVRESGSDALPSAVVHELRGGWIASVSPLAAVPAAARLGREIARRADATPGLVGESEMWTSIAHDRLASALPAVARVRDDVERLPEADRERIVETVLRVSASGSMKQTAEAMFVHRNTVVNRLAAFRGATGLDVTVPAQAALALIGLGRRPPR